MKKDRNFHKLVFGMEESRAQEIDFTFFTPMVQIRFSLPRIACSLPSSKYSLPHASAKEEKTTYQSGFCHSCEMASQLQDSRGKGEAIHPFQMHISNSFPQFPISTNPFHQFPIPTISFPQFPIPTNSFDIPSIQT